jgi:ATP-binding cassette subfamily B protein
VDKNKRLNDVAVEYIGGIEVIKAFNQSASSYEKSPPPQGRPLLPLLTGCARRCPFSHGHVGVPGGAGQRTAHRYHAVHEGQPAHRNFIVSIILSLALWDRLSPP